LAISERLLQFIWQFQYFNSNELCTQTGDTLQVLATGRFNGNQGPDFMDARVMIGKTTWAGTVELHVKASDWKRHRHQDDKNYNNVVLHVVWEDDESNAGSLDDIGPNQKKCSPWIPILELQSRVPKILLQRYDDLLQSPSFIPCEKSIGLASEITWRSWKDSLLAARLLRKSAAVQDYLQHSDYHWEETFWWMLAKNFGMKVNAEGFEAIARSLPLTLLAKHKHQIHQLEALLLGQGGLLQQEFVDKYPKLLQREYTFLQRKYNLQPVPVPLHSLRMRPVNFPAVRLAELAMLVHTSAHLFSQIKEAKSAAAVRKYFEVTANDYWHYHYQLDEAASFRQKNVGASMIDNIIINTVAPVLFAYGNYYLDNQYKDRAIDCLEEVAAEKNSITMQFQMLGIENKNARDSQALIELRNEFCDKRRCLECSIGDAILKQPGQ
jgi:hypothetical protein